MDKLCRMSQRSVSRSSRCERVGPPARARGPRKTESAHRCPLIANVTQLKPIFGLLSVDIIGEVIHLRSEVREEAIPWFVGTSWSVR